MPEYIVLTEAEKQAISQHAAYLYGFTLAGVQTRGAKPDSDEQEVFQNLVKRIQGREV